jgi:hypothetical protein
MKWWRTFALAFVLITVSFAGQGVKIQGQGRVPQQPGILSDSERNRAGSLRQRHLSVR